MHRHASCSLLTRDRVPPNVRFEVDDVESPWIHENKFDFIFSRYLAACILDWPKFVKNAFE